MRTGYTGKISYRRWLLNQCLAKNSDVFTRNSVVLDVGGKKEIGSKGYHYPLQSVGAWMYLNIDATSNPDVLADATDIPLEDASVDVVVCTEVLEHLATPALCIEEIWRVLKPGGVFIGSAPFVFPVHGDPSDYYRYTESGLRYLQRRFSIVKIEPMGGSLGAIGLLLEQEVLTLARSRFLRSVIRRTAVAMSRRDFANKFEGSTRLTTGWFWRSKK